MAKPHHMGTDRVCRDCHLTDTEINADLVNSLPCVPSRPPPSPWARRIARAVIDELGVRLVPHRDNEQDLHRVIDAALKGSIL